MKLFSCNEGDYIMKKNIVVSMIAGVLLVATACGRVQQASYSNFEDKADTIVLGEDEIPMASEISSEDADSVEAPEVEDFFASLDEIKPGKDGTITNGLFSVTMPAGADGTYLAYSTKDSIYVYDKASKEAGFGGFVYKISVYKDPSEYYGGMDTKVGEMTLSDGTVYDVIKEEASDVQWDYQTYQEMPEEYARLYNSFDEVVKTLDPFDMGSFTYEGGTKGEDLYGAEIAKIRTAVEEGYDANTLEEMGLSSMYYVISQDNGIKALKKIGYAFCDVNVDGIDELLVGEIADGDMKGVIYDIFTMQNRQPVHVVSGYQRDRYYVQKAGGMLINEASGGADINIWTLYELEPNSTTLYQQYALKYDKQENENNPYFMNRFSEGEEWENISEEDFNMFKDRMEYNRLDYTPLG
jgi:hypothetical protein